MLYRHLDEIRRRPGMYLGEPSLKALWHYIAGFQSAMRASWLHEIDEPEFRQFHDFVARRLGFYESTSGWYNMITAEEASEEAALERFFELLDEFRGRERQVLMTVEVGTKAAEKWRSVHRRWNKRVNGGVEDLPAPAPDRLRVVRFSPDLGVYLEGEYAGGWQSERWFETLNRCLETCQDRYQIDPDAWTLMAEHPMEWTREYSVREIESSDPERVVAGFHLLAHNGTDADVVEEMAVHALTAVSDLQSLPILRALQQTRHRHGGWSSMRLAAVVESLTRSEYGAVHRLAEDLLERIDCSKSE